MMYAIIKVSQKHLYLVTRYRVVRLLRTTVFDESLIEYVTHLLRSLFNQV